MASGDEPDQRRFERSKVRIPCALELPESSHAGFVLDLSASGLFVQTSASAEEGTKVRLILREPGRDPIALEARVVRLRGSHRSVAAVRTGGLGFALSNAPEAYFQLLVELGLA
jgi:hypothetical protein